MITKIYYTKYKNLANINKKKIPKTSTSNKSFLFDCFIDTILLSYFISGAKFSYLGFFVIFFKN